MIKLDERLEAAFIAKTTELGVDPGDRLATIVRAYLQNVAAVERAKLYAAREERKRARAEVLAKERGLVQ